MKFPEIEKEAVEFLDVGHLKARGIDIREHFTDIHFQLYEEDITMMLICWAVRP